MHGVEAKERPNPEAVFWASPFMVSVSMILPPMILPISSLCPLSNGIVRKNRKSFSPLARILPFIWMEAGKRKPASPNVGRGLEPNERRVR